MAVSQKLIVPPLAGGDRLFRDEFERRYAASPHMKIAGVKKRYCIQITE